MCYLFFSDAETGPTIQNRKKITATLGLVVHAAGRCTGYYWVTQLPIVLASRVSEHHLDTQTLKNQPSGHPNIFVSNFFECHFQIYNLIFFRPNINPVAFYEDILTQHKGLFSHKCRTKTPLFCEGESSKYSIGYHTCISMCRYCTLICLHPLKV